MFKQLCSRASGLCNLPGRRTLAWFLLALAGMSVTSGAWAEMTMAKSFTPDWVAEDGVSTLRVSFVSTSTAAITNLSFTDNLPAGMVVAAAPSSSTTCGGGTVTATAGSSTVQLTGGTLAASSNCAVTVNVRAIAGTANTSLNNIIAVGNVSNAQNEVPLTNSAGVAAQASLSVIGSTSFTLSKAFVASGAVEPSIAGFPYDTYLNSPYELVLHFRNPQNAAVTGLKVTDNLPGGVQYVTGASPSYSNCGAPNTTGSTASVLQFSNLTLAANPSSQATLDCVIRVRVTSSASAVLNTLYENVIVPTDTSNTSNAKLVSTARALVRYVPPRLSVGKQMTLDTARRVTSGRQLVKVTAYLSAAGGTIDLASAQDALGVRSGGAATLLPDNTNAYDVVTGASVGVLPRKTTCTGQSLSSSGNTLTLTGGTINAGQSCQAEFWFEVPGCDDLTNYFSNISASSGGTALPASSIYAQPAYLVKDTFAGNVGVTRSYYGSPPIAEGPPISVATTAMPAPVGTTGRAAYLLKNTSSATLTNLTYSDTFPTISRAGLNQPNLVVASNPAPQIVCRANDGAGAVVAGIALNSPSFAAGATSVSFAINTLPPHTACVVSFSQTAREPALPAAAFASPFFADPPSSSAIPASSLNYSASVSGACAPTSYNNALQYRVLEGVPLEKKFVPRDINTTTTAVYSANSLSSVRAGDIFSTAILISNFFAPTPLTNMAFSDQLPDGLALAPNPNVRGSCLASTSAVYGTPSISAPPGGTLFGVSGLTPTAYQTDYAAQFGYNPTARCSILFDVLATRESAIGPNNQPVPFVNTLPAGALTATPAEPLLPPSSANVGNVPMRSPDPTTASVVATKGALQAAISFNPSTVAYGRATRLIVTLATGGGHDVKNLAFATDLPPDVVFAPSTTLDYQAPSTTCGGTVATTGSQLQLSGGGFGINTASCEVAASVLLQKRGTFVGTLAAGAASSSVGNNPSLVSASVTSLPVLQVAKIFAPAQAKVGDTVRVTLALTNPEIAAQTGIRVTDVLPAGLAPGQPLMVTPAAANACQTGRGQAATPSTNGTDVGFNDITLAAGASCSLEFNVLATGAGTALNQIRETDVSADSSGAQAQAPSGLPPTIAAEATLTVTAGVGNGGLATVPTLGAPALAVLAIALGAMGARRRRRP